MSTNRDNLWEDEEDDDVQVGYSQGQDTEQFRALRKQFNALKKSYGELETKYSSLNNSQKERAIKDVLTSKGVRQSIAKYIPADIEPTETAIESWLAENAEDFGLQFEQKQQVNADDVNALRQMDRTLDGAASPASSDDLMARIAQHDGSVEDFLSMIRGE